MEWAAGDLPDDAILIRGGLMESDVLDANARDHQVEHPGEWAISCAAGPVEDLAEILEGVSWMRNRQVRLTTVGKVRALGHEVVPSPPSFHVDVILSDQPSEGLWEDLRGVFGPPMNKAELMEADE